MHPALRTRLCDLLGVDYPIVQTGMGWVATPELVTGSCNAGAFGFLAGATLRPDEIEPAILRVKAGTDRPFGVNFLMEQPNAEQVVDLIIRHGVRVAGYNRAPNPKLIERLKAAGVVCMPTIGARRHAQKAVQLGADVLIAQGGEGGGHTGSVPTSLLLPQVVNAVDVPVVGAGGFRDGRGLVAALAFGASGIAMGTRFLMTAESRVPAATKEHYLAASVDDTVVTRRIDGLPQRLIRVGLVLELERSGPLSLYWRALRSALEYRKLAGASLLEVLRSGLSMRRSQGLSPAQMLMAANEPVMVREALVAGHSDRGILPTGQVTGLIEDVPTCADLVGRIIAEAEHVLNQLAGAPIPAAGE
ncbi:MAG: nitronate monooxygenase [Chloroflexota bacterium]|nr:nitronate monooxygenase [Chloroflexota bacterium]